MDTSLKYGYSEGSWTIYGPNIFTRNFQVNIYSSGEVENLGMTQIEYDVFVNEIQISVETKHWNNSVTYYSEGPSRVDLSRNDNLTYIGFVNVKFNVEGAVQNETIAFQVSTLFSLYKLHIKQTIISIYTLEIFDIIGIIALIYVLYRLFKKDGYPLHFSEEIIKKDKEYFDFLRKYQKDDDQTSKKQE